MGKACMGCSCDYTAGTHVDAWRMRCPIIAIEHDPIQTYYCRYTSHFIVSDTPCLDGDKTFIARSEARDDAWAENWVEFSDGLH